MTVTSELSVPATLVALQKYEPALLLPTGLKVSRFALAMIAIELFTHFISAAGNEFDEQLMFSNSPSFSVTLFELGFKVGFSMSTKIYLF